MPGLFHSRVLTALMAFAILAVAVAAIFWPILSQYDTPAILGAGDSWEYFGPLNLLGDYAIHHGELPQWDPTHLGGAPFAADPQSWFFYPPNFVRALLDFPLTPYSMHLGLVAMIVLHFIAAGLSTFLFAREHNMRRGAALVTAFGYVFAANYVYRAFGHPHLDFTVAWLPLLLVVLRRALDTPAWPAKLWLGTLGSLVFALVVLAGFPQLTFFVCFTAGFYALLHRLTHLPWSTARDPRSLGRLLAGDLGAFVAIFALGGLLSLAMLLPLVEFAGFSPRSAPTGSDLYAARANVPLLRALVAYPGEEDVKGFKAAGAGVLMLALMAWAHGRRRDVLVHAALFGILLDCSFGPRFPFGRLSTFLLPFEASVPARVTLLMCFPLAMLAGFGADALASEIRQRWRRGLLSLAVALLAGGVLWLLHGLVMPHPWLPVSRAVFYLPAALAVAMVAAPWLPRWPWAAVFAALVIAEIFTWNVAFVPRFNLQPYHLWPGEMASLHKKAALPRDNYRRSSIDVKREKYDLVPVMSGLAPLRIEAMHRLMCSPMVEGQYRRHIDPVEPVQQNVRGNLFLKRSFWLCRQYVRAPLPPKYQAFPATTTVFLPNASGLPLPEVTATALPTQPISSQYERVTTLSGAQIRPLEPPRHTAEGTEATFEAGPIALPPRHCVLAIHARSNSDLWLLTSMTDPDTGETSHGLTARQPASLEQPWQTLVALPDFPRMTIRLRALLDDAAQGEITIDRIDVLADLADENDRIEIVDRTLNTVRLQVGPLDGNRMLLFTDPMYPGWQAYVDGRRVPIHLANDALKAVLLPSGTHEVRFVFDSPAVRAGLTVSVATLLFVVLFLLWGWRHGWSRRKAEEDGGT